MLALSKKFNTTIPLQAETKAILWATSITVEQRLNWVCFKSDSKMCMDCLSSPRSDSHWRISCSMSQIRSLASSHPSWSFQCVCREANSTPDALASWSLSCYSWDLFSFCNSLASFCYNLYAGLFQCLLLAVFFLIGSYIIFLFIKKENNNITF